MVGMRDGIVRDNPMSSWSHKVLSQGSYAQVTYIVHICYLFWKVETVHAAVGTNSIIAESCDSWIMLHTINVFVTPKFTELCMHHGCRWVVARQSFMFFSGSSQNTLQEESADPEAADFTRFTQCS